MTRANASDASSEELLALALRAARGAGELLLERFRGGEVEGVQSKSTPTDLVSEADVAAERRIRATIAAARPRDGMVGEEGDDEPGSSGLRWVVDPLDGTVDFVFGIPQWCVSVAVQDGDGTVAGAICDPLRGELFTAVRGGEARLVCGDGFGGSDGREERVLRGSPRGGELASAMVATGFAYDARVREAQARVLTRVLPRVRDIRRAGSAALDLAWTAAGRYDAFYERGVKVWDVAAGLLLCERAGLRVVELAAAGVLPSGVLVAPEGLVEGLRELVGGE